MFHTSRILHAVSNMCVSKLSAVGVRTLPAQAGYYIFPDFEVVREGLNKRAIFTGQQMCDAILKEANVSVCRKYLTNDMPHFCYSQIELR